MGRKLDLEQKMKILRDEVRAIEDAEWLKDHLGLIGKYFKYRNCYSCPKDISDHWSIFYRVEAIEGGMLTGLEFQTDKDGEISIKANRLRRGVSDWTKIDKAEFETQLRILKREVAAL